MRPHIMLPELSLFNVGKTESQYSSGSPKRLGHSDILRGSSSAPRLPPDWID